MLSALNFGQAQAQTLPRVEVPKPPVFTEDEPPLSRYSPTDVLGVLSGNLMASASSPIIVVSGLRDKEDKTICVHIERSNGGYVAAFNVANPRKGPTVELAMPSRIIPKIKAIAGELAINAQASTTTQCADSSPSLAASWGVRGGRDVAVLINSQRATYAAIETGGEAPVRCERLENVLSRPTIGKGSFDMVCRARMAGACGTDQGVTVQLRDGARVRGNSPRFVLRTPCGG